MGQQVDRPGGTPTQSLIGRIRAALEGSAEKIEQTPGFTGQHARYFAVETVLSILLNAGVCAFYAWLPFRHLDVVPLWGLASISVDLIPTTLMAVTMVTFAVTGLTRIRMRLGIVPTVRWPRDEHPVLAKLPYGVLKRSVLIGGTVTAVAVPVAIACLYFLGVSEMPFATFFQVKVIYGAAIGLLYTPLVLFVAFSDSVEKLRTGLWLWW